MTTITLALLDLRDIFTDFSTSAALNAARAHEIRQPYANADAALPSRIVPAELAQAIATADPDQQVFVVHIKTLAPGQRDQWTPSPHYGVVWSVADWNSSAECRFQRAKNWSAERAEFFQQKHETNRLPRMLDKLCAFFPGSKQEQSKLRTIATDIPTEAELKQWFGYFEAALKTKIYEPPQTEVSEGRETGDSRSQEGDEGRIQTTPQASTATGQSAD